ncbi:MAG TPA: DUF433 domain-containing protein [Chloroflexota bacterium]|nr:DUF433 domain-containing protein [Chloroflexota bacterium]
MRDLQAFGAEHVTRLTGLTDRQLRYWDQTGFFSPHYAADDGSKRPHYRVYSFPDLVGLRTIALLRKDYHVPLQELRKIGAWLKQHYDSPWSSLRFYVIGRRVYFDDPVTGARIATSPQGQTVMPFEMETIANSVRKDAERLQRRDPEQEGHITTRRTVLNNTPVVAGTRVPTEAIWNFYEAGYDTDAIIREYPQLTAADVRAAITYEESRRSRRARAG